MMIRRPEEKSGGKTITMPEMLQYGQEATLIQNDPHSRVLHRSFYQAGSWLYTETLQLKTAQTGDINKVFMTVDRCRESADQAREAGFSEEAAALSITLARLCHRAYSIAQLLHSFPFTKSQLMDIFLDAFERLGTITVLPKDDSEYWQARLAEVVAALFQWVAAYDYKGADRIERVLRSVSGVAQVTQSLVPDRFEAPLVPLRFADFYPGSEARIHASLAHLEILAQLSRSAVARSEQLLCREIIDEKDRVYALMVGLDAARRQARDDLHSKWFEQLQAKVDSAREQYGSFEGRLYAQHSVFSQFEYALRTWALNDLHAAEDLLAVAEALKARVLLDEIGGCGIPAQRKDDSSTSPASRTKPDATSKEVSPAPKPRFLRTMLEGLPNDVLSEINKLSYWSIEGSSGFEADAPSEQEFARKNHLDTLEKLRRDDDERVALHGGFQGSVRAAEPSQIRAALEPDELLIEFFIPRDPFAPNRYCWILVIHRDGAERVGFYLDPETASHQVIIGDRLVERGPLSDLAAETRAAILQGDDTTSRGHLRRFFELLIEPVIAMGYEPERFRRWIMIPHGPLHLVPLHALVDAQGRHLIERVPVTTAPSATVWLKMLATQPQSVATHLAVGNPALTGVQPPLPDAEIEVNEIQKYLTGCRPLTPPLIGPMASEGRVKAAMLKANILHFATHSELDLTDPRDGHRILLARDANQDGELHAVEVRDMDLRHVALAVLNTCDGVVCRYGSGDEPLGLLAAFISAGAGNVLGGLWELSDKAARDFILKFYAAFQTGDTVVAFQTAAQRSIGEGQRIAHWAGLSLVGPARPLSLSVT